MTEPPDVPQELARYLSPSERVVIVQRRHWIVVAEPVATAVVGLAVLGWLTSAFDDSPDVVNILVVAYLVVVARALWRVYDWRRDLFVATNARLINAFGVLTRKVATMPLSKVTDLSYIRSPWGKLLGWGTFRLESAGQDQALGTIRYVIHPDETYRTIATQLFRPSRPDASEPTRTSTPTSTDSQLPFEEPDDAWWRR